MPHFPGLTHVALTVTDLRASTAWYHALLGADPVLDEDAGGFHHAVFPIGDAMLLGLHSHPATDQSDRFDETRAGLDHVGFACSNRAELEQWISHLDQLSIAHGGIVDAHYGSGVSFRDPDNIALEFFAPPATT